MSKLTPPQDWEKIWNEYNKALKTWMDAFESLQEATTNVQSKCGDVMTKAIKESSDKTLNQFIENWQKSMSDVGIKTFQQYGDNWQKIFNHSGIEQVKNFGELMNNFAETWKKMWNK
jgi:hypothetical protein